MEHITVLIVEDEVLIAEDLKDMLNTFGIKNVRMAHDSKSAMQFIELFSPQIVLLDIRMEKETDGLEIGKYLQTKNNIDYIYITAHSDVSMVKKIIETQPAGYITKPIKKSDLFANINLVAARQAFQEKKSIHVKDGYSTIIIPHEEIIYLESDGNYVHIIADNKKALVRQSLDSLISELNSIQFFKIHRSYAINILRVVEYSRKEVKIMDITLPISRNAADSFEKIMLGQK